MLLNDKFIVLSILIVLLKGTFGYTQHNSTFLLPDDDPLAKIPVEFEANFPLRSSASELQKHVDAILNPLMPYIRADSNPDRRLAKRQTQQVQLNNNYVVQLFQYAYTHIVAAQIGPFTFS